MVILDQVIFKTISTVIVYNKHYQYIWLFYNIFMQTSELQISITLATAAFEAFKVELSVLSIAVDPVEFSVFAMLTIKRQSSRTKKYFILNIVDILIVDTGW